MRQMSIRCKPPKRKPTVGVDYIGRGVRSRGTGHLYSFPSRWAVGVVILTTCLCLYSVLIFLMGFLAGVRYIG